MVEIASITPEAAGFAERSEWCAAQQGATHPWLGNACRDLESQRRVHNQKLQ